MTYKTPKRTMLLIGTVAALALGSAADAASPGQRLVKWLNQYRGPDRYLLYRVDSVNLLGGKVVVVGGQTRVVNVSVQVWTDLPEPSTKSKQKLCLLVSKGVRALGLRRIDLVDVIGGKGYVLNCNPWTNKILP